MLRKTHRLSNLLLGTTQIGSSNIDIRQNTHH